MSTAVEEVERIDCGGACWIWVKVCKCHIVSSQTTGDIICPVHGRIRSL